MVRLPLTRLRRDIADMSPARSALRRWLALPAALTLNGCSAAILDPGGPISSAEKMILLDSLGIMLAIVIPTILATVGIAWWFRSGNTRAHYIPDWNYSGRLEMIVWSIPAMTVLLLGGIGWIGSHALDPALPIPSKVKPVTVEVVSLDWKWLFIYPEQCIATVNHLVIPVGTPISFKITSSGVMNSFFVPRLGSQIYAMANMVTKLQLQADQPGAYPGLSAQFSGDGFSGMRFTVDAVPISAFSAWVAQTRDNGPSLNNDSYAELAKPSQEVAPSTYRAVTPGLFAAIAHAPGQSDTMKGD